MPRSSELERLREAGETTLSKHFLAEREKYREEGRAEGVVAERDLLRRLAARKFDAATAERLADLLARIDDPERLAEAGDWIIECAAAGELLARVAGIANAAGG